MTDKNLEVPFRVLSLDGGGMRGVYTATFLNKICIEFAKRRDIEGILDIGKGFDLIVGTSTGAIIGSAAAIGCPMQVVINLFKDHGQDIFPHRIQKNRCEMFRAVFRQKKSRAEIQSGDQALRDILTKILMELTLTDVFNNRGISMCVPTILMSTNKSWVFKKTNNPNKTRDENYKLVDICLASSAAPIYRSLALINSPETNTPQVFADGGLWANNPILVALVEAIGITECKQTIEIYSLGTCPRPEGEYIEDDSVHRSMMDWTFGADILPLSINAQEFAFDNMAKFLANSIRKLGQNISITRFPVGKVPADLTEYLAIDDARPEAIKRLISQAETDVYETLSACDNPQDSDGQKIVSLMNNIPVWDQTTSLYQFTEKEND